MPRLARLDAPGILHHVILRGIERRKIFKDDQDRNNFLERLSDLLPATKTPCYAWALLPNHAHFLFQSGETGLSTLMRRLLTGYAVTFNRRHRRHGQLFQNRLGYDFDRLERKVAELYSIDIDDLYARGRQKKRVEARSLFCCWAVCELGLSGTSIAKRFGMSQPGVVYAVNKGERIAKENKYELLD